MRTLLRGLSVLLAGVIGACHSGVDHPFDLVLTGGRVIDPESVRNVGIRDGTITAITEADIAGRESLDVSGLVVAPGFIDLHAHGQDNASSALQVEDGVTTALDLELGAYPVGDLIAKRAGKAIVNYGVSAGHMAIER